MIAVFIQVSLDPNTKYDRKTGSGINAINILELNLIAIKMLKAIIHFQSGVFAALMMDTADRKSENTTNASGSFLVSIITLAGRIDRVIPPNKAANRPKSFFR